MICEKMCISAVLDSDSEKQITEIQRAVGRRECVAHITLGVYESVEADDITAWAEEFSKGRKQIGISYSGIGVVSGKLIYAIPRVNGELWHLYEELHKKYDEFANSYTSLAVGRWTPHTVLCAYSPERFETANKLFREISGRIIGLKVVDCTADRFEVVYYKALGES